MEQLAHASEVGVALFEAPGDAFVFFAAECARRVNEATSVANVRGAFLENAELQMRERVKPGGVDAPAKIRAAAKGSELGARSVDEHGICPQISGRPLAVNDDVIGVRVLGAAAQALELVEVDVTGVDGRAE